ncbi:MAG: SGNH/GDSL hydrolase family protein [Chitinophagales bacterium]
MKYFFTALFSFFYFFHTSVAQDACTGRQSAHIRLVGDSWLHFPALYHAYDSALAKHGFADYFTVSDGSALISMTAETWWQFPLARIALEASLSTDAARPIDIVMVSLGGNDVGFPFDADDSISLLVNELASFQPIMDSIFDFIHAKIPKAQIIWQGYDYPNFSDPCFDYVWNPYCDTWNDNGNFTPFQINRFLEYFTHYQDSVVVSYQKPYMHSFNPNGLMQYCFGQTTPLRYPPYGTYPPRTVPFPGGYLNYPSPHAAMGLLGIDAYHLGPQGYTYLAEFYMRKFINNYLRRERDTSVYSMGQSYDGWVSANTVTGTGDVQIGKRNTQNTRGIFSFNTNFIPDNKIIKKAYLFLKCKDVKTPYPLGNPFPQTFTLDIKSGSFGNSSIEASDYNEAASLSDVACFTGTLLGRDYTLRADIHANALQYINKTGVTQFRLDVTDDNLITFFNGDTTEFEGPYLDIYYDTTSIVSGIINKQNLDKTLQLFPNPATTQVTLQLNKEWLHKKSTVSIYNTEGKFISTENNIRIETSELKVDVSKLAAGGYFISIENDENKAVGTFVKVKD